MTQQVKQLIWLTRLEVLLVNKIWHIKEQFASSVKTSTFPHSSVVEQLAVNQLVLGSNPSGGANCGYSTMVVRQPQKCRYSTGLSALDFHSRDEGWIPSIDSNNTKAKSE